MLVDPSGYVVTNYHVIRNADEVRIATSDGREFTSTILLKDEALDLAVLKVEAAEPFPVVPLGDSDALLVGDLVLAIDPGHMAEMTDAVVAEAQKDPAFRTRVEEAAGRVVALKREHGSR